MVSRDLCLLTARRGYSRSVSFYLPGPVVPLCQIPMRSVPPLLLCLGRREVGLCNGALGGIRSLEKRYQLGVIKIPCYSPNSRKVWPVPLRNIVVDGEGRWGGASRNVNNTSCGRNVKKNKQTVESV